MGLNQRVRDAVVSRPGLLAAIRLARHRFAKLALTACGPFVLREALAERESKGAARPEEDRDLELYALRALCDRAVARAEDERRLRLAAEARLEAAGAP